MPAYAIIGGQWGDEGKGKVVDFLSGGADIVARFNGGNNAGHTVITGAGEFKFHLIPVGILRPATMCLIGNGVVINPDSFLQEVRDLQNRSVDVSNLFISDKAHVVMPYHVLLDRLEEKVRSQGGRAIGTTGMGIGPAYVDKAARIGIRMADLLDKTNLYSRLSFVLEQKNALIQGLYGQPPISIEHLYEQCVSWAEKLEDFIRPIEQIISVGLANNKRIILEGAQGSMLDIDHGTYPFVTASSSTVGGACTGLGISPAAIDQVAGVYKAYTTRVGEGPLPTELDDEIGDFIREKAWEYGTTTGRPRRCGWFDAVAARYSAGINGMTSLIITRLDVLDGISPVKICVGYRLNGEILDTFPTNSQLLTQCQPVYEDFPGWQNPTAGVTNIENLPPEAFNYIKRLEELVGCTVDMISTGPDRDESIVLKPIFG